MSGEILRAFVGTRCESCGDQKRKHMAFCIACYGTLPREMKNLLWQRFGEGFEEGYEVALNWLRKDRAETDRLLEGA